MYSIEENPKHIVTKKLPNERGSAVQVLRRTSFFVPLSCYLQASCDMFPRCEPGFFRYADKFAGQESGLSPVRSADFVARLDWLEKWRSALRSGVAVKHCSAATGCDRIRMLSCTAAGKGKKKRKKKRGMPPKSEVACRQKSITRYLDPPCIPSGRSRTSTCRAGAGCCWGVQSMHYQWGEVS